MDRLPLFRARYRVLVLKNDEPQESHHAVIAICLELNLVGRGETEPEALQDLDGILEEALFYSWQNKVPVSKPDPDPALANAFETGAKTVEGAAVLDWLCVNIETELVKTRALKPKGRRQRAVYEPCFA